MSRETKIVHAAEQKLDHSSHLFRRTVSCRYSNGTLRLDGKVPTFYLKQMAQALLRDVEGVTHVDNALQVVNPAGISSEPALT